MLDDINSALMGLRGRAALDSDRDSSVAPFEEVPVLMEEKSRGEETLGISVTDTVRLHLTRLDSGRAISGEDVDRGPRGKVVSRGHDDRITLKVRAGWLVDESSG